MSTKQLKALAERSRTAKADADGITARFHEAICQAHGAEGLTYNQIAEATGLSYGRVRQIVAEGRQEADPDANETETPSPEETVNA